MTDEGRVFHYSILYYIIAIVVESEQSVQIILQQGSRVS